MSAKTISLHGVSHFPTGGQHGPPARPAMRTLFLLRSIFLHGVFLSLAMVAASAHAQSSTDAAAASARTDTPVLQLAEDRGVNGPINLTPYWKIGRAHV